MFLNFLNRSITAGYLVLGILILRWVFRKAPRSFWLLAWAMVGLRLICPIHIESQFSLVPDPAPISNQVTIQVQEEPLESLPLGEPVDQPVVSEHELSHQPAQGIAPTQAKKTDLRQTSLKIGGLVWLAGMGGMLAYAGISWIRIRLRVREAVEQDGLYFCDHIETPFLLGWVHPKIYLPSDIAGEDVPYVAAHEKSHMRHGDHWWKPLGFVLLAVYWFNPMIWVAYLLFSRDLEYACDERAVRGLDTAWRKSYMQALIDCSASRRTLGLVAFGEVGVKERVKNIMAYQKPGFWITLIALVAAGALGVFFLTNRPQEEPVHDVIEVQNVDEFLAALGSDREIVLGPGNFELSEAADYGKDFQNSSYRWNQCRDGYELRIENVHGLTIRGDGKDRTSLVTSPRSAHVLDFLECEDIELENLTAGHTVMAEPCVGGVLGFQLCDNVQLVQTGLYGCGVDGVDAYQTQRLSILDSDIYDCSVCGINTDQCSEILVDGCRFYNLGTEIVSAQSVFYLVDCKNVTIENSEIRDNMVSEFIFAQRGSNLTLKNNLWKSNWGKIAAFDFTDISPLMEKNRFMDNDIRQWYVQFSNSAVDENGNILDESFFAPNVPADQNNPTQKQVHAATVDELIAAIAPDTQIVLDAELYDLSTAKGYGTEKGDYYYWHDNFDGPQLVIYNVENFSITTNDGNRKAHTISAVPRYANVLAFERCRDVSVSGFTAGHTKEPGSCLGGVIFIEYCDNMTVENCGLFGCGILGVQANFSEGITVADCEIYECSNGGIEMRNVKNAAIDNCTFRDLGGEPLFFSACEGVTVDGSAYNAGMAAGIQNSAAETDEDYYSQATSLPASQVEQFAMEVKENILNHQWDSLAEKIAYPITIENIVVDNSEHFLALVSENQIHPEFLSAVEHASCAGMFCNYQGIMMGAEGQVWLGAVYGENGEEILKIMGINGIFQ